MIPDKHDTVWWWTPFARSDAVFPLGVELVGTPQPDPLDWHVWHCAPMPDSPLGMGWFGTGRRVRDIGGVWLGPAEPPRATITTLPMPARDKALLLRALTEPTARAFAPGKDDRPYPTGADGDIIWWCPKCRGQRGGPGPCGDCRTQHVQVRCHVRGDRYTFRQVKPKRKEKP